VLPQVLRAMRTGEADTMLKTEEARTMALKECILAFSWLVGWNW